VKHLTLLQPGAFTVNVSMRAAGAFQTAPKNLIGHIEPMRWEKFARFSRGERMQGILIKAEINRGTFVEIRCLGGSRQPQLSLIESAAHGFCPFL
jgi:hypothetical protein